MSDYPLNIEKRPRYFDGQYLQVDDFADEQRYHMDRQQRVSRCLHVSGILEGLEVAIKDKTTLTITQGAAVDSLGRQILLRSEFFYNEKIQMVGDDGAEIDLTSFEADGETILKLMITWIEKDSDPQGEEGSDETTRYQELARIYLMPTDSTDQESPTAVLLAEAVFAAQTWAVELSQRQYSGLQLPSGTDREQAISLRVASLDNKVTLTGSLSVTQGLTVGGDVTTKNLITESLKVMDNLMIGEGSNRGREENTVYEIIPLTWGEPVWGEQTIDIYIWEEAQEHMQFFDDLLKVLNSGQYNILTPPNGGARWKARYEWEGHQDYAVLGSFLEILPQRGYMQVVIGLTFPALPIELDIKKEGWTKSGNALRFGEVIGPNSERPVRDLEKPIEVIVKRKVLPPHTQILVARRVTE